MTGPEGAVDESVRFVSSRVRIWSCVVVVCVFVLCSIRMCFGIRVAFRIVSIRALLAIALSMVDGRGVRDGEERVERESNTSLGVWVD